eukprot:11209612-Lingulodinium_polyedra.AAC.1
MSNFRSTRINAHLASALFFPHERQQPVTATMIRGSRMGTTPLREPASVRRHEARPSAAQRGTSRSSTRSRAR